MRELENVCVCVFVNAPPVSLCMSSRECATTAVTVRLFCCKVNGELHPPSTLHLSLSLSTAGVAVSDKRVSAAAAAADQASLPGLGIQGNTHILAQIGIRVHTHACGSRRCSLTRTQIRDACTQTTPPALKKQNKKKSVSTRHLSCADCLPRSERHYPTARKHWESIFGES